MLKLKIFNSINRLFEYPHEGSGGSAEADVATAIAGDGGFTPSTDKIEEEFLSHMMANDEDYQAIVEEEAALKKAEKPPKKPVTDEGKNVEDDGLGDEDDPEKIKKDDDIEGDSKKDDGDPGDISSPPADAKEGDNWLDENDIEYTFKGEKWVAESGEELKLPDGEPVVKTEEEEDFEYPDDVIPGLKGNHFSALPKEAQEAVAKYHQEALSYKESTKNDIEIIKILKNDPIAKHRLELIQSGKGFSQYQIPEVTKDDVDKILDADNRENAAKLINKVAQKIVTAQIDNERIADDLRRRVAEANKAGEQILREAGNLHPDIKKEQRLETFEYVEKAGHADKNTYDSYHQKIVDFCSKRGYKYADLSKMKPKELYALTAVNEGWPVAFNTEKRDTKMLTEHTMKALEHFRRSKRGKEVSRGMRSSENSSGKTGLQSAFKIRGIDVVKLATDDGYHEGVMNMKPGSVKWIDEVRELRAKGDEIIDRRKRKRKEAENRGSAA